MKQSNWNCCPSLLPDRNKSQTYLGFSQTVRFRSDSWKIEGISSPYFSVNSDWVRWSGQPFIFQCQPLKHLIDPQLTDFIRMNEKSWVWKSSAGWWNSLRSWRPCTLVLVLVCYSNNPPNTKCQVHRPVETQTDRPKMVKIICLVFFSLDGWLVDWSEVGYPWPRPDWLVSRDWSAQIGISSLQVVRSTQCQVRSVSQGGRGRGRESWENNGLSLS